MRAHLSAFILLIAIFFAVAPAQAAPPLSARLQAWHRLHSELDSIKCADALLSLEKVRVRQSETERAQAFLDLSKEVKGLREGNGEYIRHSSVAMMRRYTMLKLVLMNGQSGISEAMEVYRNLFLEVRLSYAALRHNFSEILWLSRQAEAEGRKTNPDMSLIHKFHSEMIRLEGEAEEYTVKFGEDFSEYYLVRHYLEDRIHQATIHTDQAHQDLAAAAGQLLTLLESSEADKWFDQLSVPGRVPLAKMKTFFHEYIDFVTAKLKKDRSDELKVQKRRRQFQMLQLAQKIAAVLPTRLPEKIELFHTKYTDWIPLIKHLQKMPLRQPLSQFMGLNYDAFVIDSFVDDLEMIFDTPKDNYRRLNKLIELATDGGGVRLLETMARIPAYRDMWAELKTEIKLLKTKGFPADVAFAERFEEANVSAKMLGPLSVNYRANDAHRMYWYLGTAGTFAAMAVVYWWFDIDPATVGEAVKIMVDQAAQVGGTGSGPAP